MHYRDARDTLFSDCTSPYPQREWVKPFSNILDTPSRLLEMTAEAQGLPALVDSLRSWSLEITGVSSIQDALTTFHYFSAS
jgi:hypothetical protein